MARHSDLDQIELREGGKAPDHCGLTGLEALLLRTLYTVTWDWSTEDAETTVAQLKDWEGVDDGDCALLEQLLEEERADRG